MFSKCPRRPYWLQMHNTLQQPEVRALLERLHAAAEVTDPPLIDQAVRRVKEQGGTERDVADWLGEAYMPVSPEVGRLLYWLVLTRRSKRIVEFGTSFGISTLHLAAALKDNGGGRLIGTELEPAKAARARAHLAEAGLAEYVEIREGDATQSLARDVPAGIELVLLDGAKMLYPRILALLEPQLAPGALLVADNAGDSPEYLARVRHGSRYLSLPFARDVEVSQWLGPQG